MKNVRNRNTSARVLHYYKCTTWRGGYYASEYKRKASQTYIRTPFTCVYAKNTYMVKILKTDSKQKNTAIETKYSKKIQPAFHYPAPDYL